MERELTENTLEYLISKLLHHTVPLSMHASQSLSSISMVNLALNLAPVRSGSAMDWEDADEFLEFLACTQTKTMPWHPFENSLFIPLSATLASQGHRWARQVLLNRRGSWLLFQLHRRNCFWVCYQAPLRKHSCHVLHRDHHRKGSQPQTRHRTRASWNGQKVGPFGGAELIYIYIYKYIYIYIHMLYLRL